MAQKTNTKKPIKSNSIDTKEAVSIIAEAADKAANKIDTATEKAVILLASAAKEATTTLASAAKDATTLLASNASDAVKVSNAKNEGDHDLLIRLEEKMGGIKNDIKDLGDNNTIIHNDQGKRIGTLESYKTGQTILMSIGIGLLSLETGLIIYLFTHLP